MTTTTAPGPTTLMRTLAGFCSSAIVLEFRFQFLKKKAIVIRKSLGKVHFHLNRGISGDVNRCNIDLDDQDVSLSDIFKTESSDISPSVFIIVILYLKSVFLRWILNRAPASFSSATMFREEA